MHPAYPVIFFTIASGAGYGLLAMLGLLASAGILPAGRGFAGTAVVLALGAVSFGLLCAPFRPGRTGRAVMAGSQWPTRWPARVGVLAGAAYVPAVGFAVGWVFYGQTDGVFRLFGLATTVFCGLTVHATGMIYAACTPVPAWCNRWVVPNFLALALLTGTLWLNALVNLFGRPSPDVSMVLVLALFLAFYLKRKYWRFIDSTAGPAMSAAGETGFGIARKDAAKHRRYAFVLLFALPLVCALAAMEASSSIAVPASVGAALSASAGVVIERWLFFAEAAALPDDGADAA